MAIASAYNLHVHQWCHDTRKRHADCDITFFVQEGKNENLRDTSRMTRTVAARTHARSVTAPSSHARHANARSRTGYSSHTHTQIYIVPDIYIHDHTHARCARTHGLHARTHMGGCRITYAVTENGPENALSRKNPQGRANHEVQIVN